MTIKPIDPKILGKRLKFFRQRAHISQFELENRMKASYGMISRIENGTVNPNKETIHKLAEILKLNNKEVDYSAGPLFYPATQEEINSAISEVKDYFSKKSVFAYILDDRFRFLYVSDGFAKLFYKDKATFEIAKEAFYGKPLMKLILDDEKGIATFLDEKFFNELMEYQVARIYNEMGFMEDDEHYQETVRFIESDPRTNIAWKKIKLDPVNVNCVESKIVPFKFGRININLQYSREVIPNHPRFETVEYFPTNKLLRFITNLTK